jgi:hypothetical protein
VISGLHSPVLIGALVLGLAISGWWAQGLMASNRSATAKKRLIPGTMVLTGSLFLATVAAVGAPLWLVCVVAVIVVVTGVMHKQEARFCNACGLSSFNDSRLRGADFCPRCGAKLGNGDK